MFAGFRNFFAEPFGDDMDALDWFLFVGFFMVLCIMWRIILSHLIAD